MNERCIDWRCGVLDVLEAAALHAGVVDVRHDQGWTRLTVRDVVTAQGEDWLITAEGQRLPVSEITAVRKPAAT